MIQSIILSILLVLVYQFDELVCMLVVGFNRLRNKQHLHHNRNNDHLVGTALTIALMPLLLNQVLLSDWKLSAKMLVLSLTYILFAIASAGLGRVMHELHQAQKYQGLTVFIASAQVIGGMFHPVLHQVPWRGGEERLTFAKLAFLLSLPPLAGLAFSWFFEVYYFDSGFIEYINILIIVMVGGLFINFTIYALEKYFKRANLGVLGYYRIVLGLSVAVYLIL